MLLGHLENPCRQRSNRNVLRLLCDHDVGIRRHTGTLARPLGERSPVQWGFVAALLPLLHIELSTVSVLLLAMYATTGASRAIAAAGWAAGFWTVGIVACFGSVPAYVTTLWPTLNLGDINLQVAAFYGKVPSSSVFFRLSYASSGEHLRDVFWWYVRASGWWMLPLLPVCAVWSWCRRPLDSRAALAAGLGIWAALFHCLLVPKMGCGNTDWDVFWMPVTTLPIVAGMGRMRRC
jgi:hypothetical protein